MQTAVAFFYSRLKKRKTLIYYKRKEETESDLKWIFVKLKLNIFKKWSTLWKKNLWSIGFFFFSVESILFHLHEFKSIDWLTIQFVHHISIQMAFEWKSKLIGSTFAMNNSDVAECISCFSVMQGSNRMKHFKANNLKAMNINISITLERVSAISTYGSSPSDNKLRWRATWIRLHEYRLFVVYISRIQCTDPIKRKRDRVHMHFWNKICILAVVQITS